MFIDQGVLRVYPNDNWIFLEFIPSISLLHHLMCLCWLECAGYSNTHRFTIYIGTTPGPVLLGYIIDKSCTIWQEECGEKGSCWTYDKHDLGMRIMIWWLVLKAMGVIFFYTAYRLYKPPPTLEENQKVEIATIQCNTDREVTKL